MDVEWEIVNMTGLKFYFFKTNFYNIELIINNYLQISCLNARATHNLIGFLYSISELVSIGSSILVVEWAAVAAHVIALVPAKEMADRHVSEEAAAAAAVVIEALVKMDVRRALTNPQAVAGIPHPKMEHRGRLDSSQAVVLAVVLSQMGAVRRMHRDQMEAAAIPSHLH